mmetsp:Transcript_45927/g.139464  ORF Transcript_45927/g.139464 Transcript_45927/m.139464 type:complete len:329 (-) Transcript_45927:56-1042(-)
MSPIDESTVFDLPWFSEIIGALDIRIALRLRSTCRRARAACSDRRMSEWRHGTILPAALKHRPGRDVLASTVQDIHLKWLFRESPDVRTVDLGDAPLLTDSLVRSIAGGCPGLKMFSVRRGQNMLRISYRQELQGFTSEAPLALLRACPQLEHLCLSWCEHLNGEVICEAIRYSSCRNKLKYLNFDGVPRMTDAAIASLSVCPELRDLRMRDTQATDLSPLAACSKLEELHVCRGWGVQPQGVVAACRGFRNSVRVLCCAGCPRIDRVTGLEVLRMCSSKLEVWNCVRGTDIQRHQYLSMDRREDPDNTITNEAQERGVCLDNTSVCH